jgi:K+-sensing histidine kinase KdpD
MRKPQQFRWPTKLQEMILLVGAALVINLVLYELRETTSLFFLFPIAVAITTVLAGGWYGLLATLMSTAAVLFFFVEPRFTLETTHADEWQRLGLFALYGLMAMLGARWARRNSGNRSLRLL